jgi:hypothetical protein
MPDAPPSIRDRRLPLRVRVPSARDAAAGTRDEAASQDGAARPPEPAPQRGARLAALSPALIGGAAGLLAFLLVRRSLIDDAYITLCYARNLAFHGQWALVAGHTSNSATSPLNVLLLALAALVTRHPVLGLGLVFSGTCAALTAALDGLFGRLGLRRGGAVCTALLLIADPLLLSTVGMEVTLVLLISVLLLRAALAGRPVLAGLLVAAMVLTRPDGVVIALVLVLAVPAVRRRAALVAGVAVLAALPWYLFSWLVLGALLPDSLVIKMAEKGWNGAVFGNGLYVYYQRSPVAILISLAAAVLGLLWTLPALARRGVAGPWRRPLLALTLAAAAHFGALALAAPEPFHWYYGPSVGLATVVFGGLCSRPLAGAPRAELAAGLLCVLAAAIAFDAAWGLPWRIAPISTNRATSAEYTGIGLRLPHDLRGAAVRSPGEVGELAYFCDCDIVDAFSDRGEFMAELTAWDRSGGTLRHDFVALDYLFADRKQPPQPPAYALDVVPQPAPGLPNWTVGTPWTGYSMFGQWYIELAPLRPSVR